MEAKAAGVMMFHPESSDPSKLVNLTVNGLNAGSPRTTMATSKSFQIQRNWKIAKLANTGFDIGAIKMEKILKWLAPSILAASIREYGSWPK